MIVFKTYTGTIKTWEHVSPHRHLEKSPRNRPWICKTQMYVHMFTCKREPWLLRRSSAAVTNRAWLMEVPSLARGEDKQPIAAPKPLCMTLRTSDVQGNGPKASISSALHHLAWLHCQNYCLLTFIFTSHGMTPEIHVTPKSQPLSLENRFVRDVVKVNHHKLQSSETLRNKGKSSPNEYIFKM